MMLDYYCENWRALLYDTTHQCQAYNNILVDRPLFMAHLQNCEACQKRVGSSFLVAPMTDTEFQNLVRAIWEQRRKNKPPSL